MQRWLAVLFSLLIVWDVVQAGASGSLRWGAYGAFSSIPFILLIGMIGAGLTVIVRGINRSSEGGLCFLIWAGYGTALSCLRPTMFEGMHNPDWLISLLGFVAAGAVISGGNAVDEALSNRKKRNTSPV